VIDNAKLTAKRCDLIVANNVAEPNAGFAVDTNHVQLVDADGEVDVPPAPKSEVAHRILDKIVTMLDDEQKPVKRAIAAKSSRAKKR
jgi:phosphopantothenoylcysteine decarboxylase / phosphopantothenate---cysteine ligase